MTDPKHLFFQCVHIGCPETQVSMQAQAVLKGQKQQAWLAPQAGVLHVGMPFATGPACIHLPVAHPKLTWTPFDVLLSQVGDLLVNQDLALEGSTFPASPDLCRNLKLACRHLNGECIKDGEREQAAQAECCSQIPHLVQGLPKARFLAVMKIVLTLRTLTVNRTPHRYHCRSWCTQLDITSSQASSTHASYGPDTVEQPGLHLCHKRKLQACFSRFKGVVAHAACFDICRSLVSHQCLDVTFCPLITSECCVLVTPVGGIVVRACMGPYMVMMCLPEICMTAVLQTSKPDWRKSTSYSLFGFSLVR